MRENQYQHKQFYIERRWGRGGNYKYDENYNNKMHVAKAQNVENNAQIFKNLTRLKQKEGEKYIYSAIERGQNQRAKEKNCKNWI